MVPICFGHDAIIYAEYGVCWGEATAWTHLTSDYPYMAQIEQSR